MRFENQLTRIIILKMKSARQLNGIEKNRYRRSEKLN